MDRLVTEARQASPNPSDCRRTIDSLRAIGFGQDAFRLLHHQHGSMVKFYSYSQSVLRFRDDENNHRVHQRLIYVLRSSLDGATPKGKSFESLAKEAFRLIPPTALHR